MTEGDLDEVVAVARVAFPNHPEDRACFAERLGLNPRGCFVLDGSEGVRGYLVAYPWRREAPPALNTLVGAVPDGADVLYLHDLALDPRARGAGHARPIIERLARQAAAEGWPAIALVAVNDAAVFWQSLGFQPVESPALRTRLASYGPDARYMIRPL
ncbi:MAG: GNAT family N-acetyltransferase [Brevundimonas sp.]|nr:GNAT family N-acetyltransferase [Brevundimonas sp.]